MWKGDGMPTVIAIDGPAGSGKSTLSRRLAAALGLAYLNTGLMYRALAFRALTQEVSPNDEAALLGILEEMEFGLSEGLSGEGPASLMIDGDPPVAALERAEVEASVSQVARHPGVRAAMRELQRALGSVGAVVEGRDIGTVVFPDADLKIFLVADEGRRAERRRRDRDDHPGVEEALASRDRLDARVNALAPAADASVIDTGEMDADRTFEAALALVTQHVGEVSR